MLPDDSNEETLTMAVTTALLESQTPITPDAARNDRIRTRVIAAAHASRDAASAVSGAFDANGLFTLRAEEGEWVSVAPTLEIKLLRQDLHSRSYLLRTHPGARMPPHQHVDVEEECYVLEGEARIGDLRLTQGDFHLAPRGVPHDWLCSDSGALLLLRADNQ